MTEEDEEFNRIERESMMRMKAVQAVVTRGGSRTTIEMAREAGIRYCTCGCLERFASLVRADERAQRTWQGLTDEEIEQGCKESWVTEQAWQSAVWWAEAKLKEKNT